MFPARMSMHTPVLGAQEGQLRTLGPLALELRVVVNVIVGPEN